METRKWKTIKEYQDILFDFYNGIAKITINRPRYRNAFTPTTTSEISDALYYCRECQDINVVVLTGAIMTMPGLPKKPAADNIDVDENGVITGLF